MYSEFFKRDLTDQEVQDLREFTAGAKPGDSKEFFGVVLECKESDFTNACSKCVFDCDINICIDIVNCIMVTYTVKQ